MSNNKCSNKHWAGRAKLFLEDRANGATYAEIAKKYGISRQRVQQVCKKWSKKQCIYINLRKWMNDNAVSIADLTYRIRATGREISGPTVRNVLEGRNSP